MSVNFNPVVPDAAHIRNIYFEQNENNNNHSAVAQQREAENNTTRIMDRRDTLNISNEARTLQRLSSMNNIHDTTLGQQCEIYRPGLDQTELRSEASLKEPRETGNEVIRGNEITANEQREEVVSREEEGLRDAPARPEQAEQEQQLPREEAKFGEAERRARSSEDMREVEANINTFNSSSLFQAYATAANVTQASFTVNYKV